MLLKEREKHSVEVQQLRAHTESEMDRLKAVISQLQNEIRVQSDHHQQQLLVEIAKNKKEQNALKQSFAKQNQEAKERSSHLEHTLETQAKESKSKCNQSEQRIR